PWPRSIARSRRCSGSWSDGAPSSRSSPPTTPRWRTSSYRSPAGSCAMRDHPLVQLTLARMREFYREPEAIFWVFGFPIVLAFALGIAFRNRGPGELRVAVLRGAGDSVLAAALARAPGLTAAVLDSADAPQSLPPLVHLVPARVPVPRGRGARGLWLVDVPRGRPGFVQCGGVHHGARRPRVRRARHAGGEPRPHHRGGLRTDEPRNAPDVDPVGHLLLIRPLPRRDAAVCEGAPAHRAERRPSCRHDRWEPAERSGRPVGHRDGM